MKIKNLLVAVLTAAVALAGAACGARSEINGEIVALEHLCAYEKKKPVAVEGYLAPGTMRCKKSKKGGVLGCYLTLYASPERTGASVPVYFMTSGWFSGKNNRIDAPESYTGDLVVRDRNGNPLPKKDLQIYDNDGNLISPERKIRVHSQLPDSAVCEISLAQRIDRL